MVKQNAAQPKLEYSGTRPNPAVTKALRSNIRISLIEGSLFSLMVGIGETYLPAFLLWMGSGNVAAGLITTLPLLAGSLLQLTAPQMLARLGSFRKWVIFCAGLQALIFLPLMVAAVSGVLPLWLAFTCVSLYWAGGLGASGAWNSWMGTLIPPAVQVGFFTRRTRVSQAMIFVGFSLGGLLLHWMPAYVDKSYAFVTIFFIAFLCRTVSLAWLTKQTEPIPPNPHQKRMTFSELRFRLSPGHEQGRLFRYLLSVTFAAHLAAPYFTSYMLAERKLTYSAYAALIAIPFLAKILFLPVFGKMIARRGARSVLALGGSGLIALPVLWLVSDRVGYLGFVQLLSGITWGAYELAALLLLWELVKPEERTCAMTAYNFANAASMSAGSMLGGLVFTYFGASGKAFIVLFSLSTLARCVTLVGLKGVARRRASDRWPKLSRTIA
jgi:MFS family permease